jgi:hypothetical protein
MGFLSLTIAVAALSLEVSLLSRAWQQTPFHRFPLFYSYIMYVFLMSLGSFIIYYIAFPYYASIYWFCLMVMFVAEFAVLLEGSDHIFERFPPIRRLGRLLTLSVCSIFFFAIILPSLHQHRSQSLALLELTRTAALTKAVLILALLAAARLFRIPLGKNIAGMLLGFATYLAITVANMALAERYGSVGYGEVFGVVGPLSYVLGLTIWNVALWRYEPVAPVQRTLRDGVKGAASTSGEGLERYNTELMRLFRR